MIQIWHGESGLSSRVLIRGFSFQNLTPNTWSLILNLGRDLYHGTCWSFWLEASLGEGPYRRSHFISMASFEPGFSWPCSPWLSWIPWKGALGVHPAVLLLRAKLQSTWPCASRSFGGCQWHCKTLGFMLELRDGPAQGWDPGKGTWRPSGLLPLSSWLQTCSFDLRFALFPLQFLKN